MSTNNSNPNLIPALSMNVTQTMSHANAFGGQVVRISFGTGTNGWSAVTGTEIERWGQGYVDLLARNGSSGLKYTFSESLAPGNYYLKWTARGRWPEDTSNLPAENKYCVRIFAGTDLVATADSVEAEVIASADPAKKCGLYFKLSAESEISIEFFPTGAGTRGPLIGTSISLEKINLEIMQMDYPTTCSERNTDKGDINTYEDRIIEDGGIAWIPGLPDVPIFCITLNCSSMKRWRLKIKVTSERIERKTLDDREYSSNDIDTSFYIHEPDEIVGGVYKIIVNEIETEEGVLLSDRSNNGIFYSTIYVRGRNPKDQLVFAYLEKEGANVDFPFAWAIATHESRQGEHYRFNQFNTSGSMLGLPNKTALPNSDGWEIAQIDRSGSKRKVEEGRDPSLLKNIQLLQRKFTIGGQIYLQ